MRNTIKTTTFLKIFGQVQRVGFRKFVYEYAKAHNFVGYVKKVMGGTVKTKFQGLKKQVKQMISLCHTEPILSQIQKVIKTIKVHKAYSSFKIE